MVLFIIKVHCFLCFPFLGADLRLPGDKRLWPEHLPGGAAVAPWQRVSGGSSEQRVHPSTHGVPRGDGGPARAGVRAESSRGNGSNATEGFTQTEKDKTPPPF